MGDKKNSIKRPNKIVALITYIIALIALLLGLFLPYGTNPELNGTTDAIWAFQLPDALSKAVPVEAFVNLLKDAEGNILGAPFAYSLPITLNGVIEGGYDLGALFTVLYALVVLAGIIALIPAIVSTFSKKSNKNTALSAASFIEVVAFLFVSIFVFIQLTSFTLTSADVLASYYQWSYPLLGAFGGTFLMLVVQSIFYKKGSGVFKFILLLLSTLALMLVVYDVGAIITALNDPLNELIGITEGLFDGRLYYSVALGTSVIGILPVLMLFCGTGGLGLPTFTDTLYAMPTAIQQTLFTCTLILALFALINFLLDAMGLGKTTKRYMLVSNIVRYTLTLVAAALVIILPFFIESATTGLMSIVIAVLALASLLLNIIRLVRFDKKRKKINKAVAAEMTANKAIDDEQPKEETVEEEEKPFVYVAPTFTEEETVEEEPQVYNPIIYNGPVDEFIKTLSTEQKVEFSRVFLERQCGNLSYIPDYVVGGNNDRFFNNVFIYFSRLRNIVSDGLFNKMYEYGNLM